MHNSYKFTANMDEYLSQLAFCRKSVVRDTSCLSRIMAEQVYFTQTLHSVVQKKCLEYLCSHREEFLKEPPSHCEMLALSKLYRYEIVIFQNPGDMPVNVTKNGFEKTVILCHVDGIHYDIVYHQSHIHALAICQSIIYDILYKGVFKLSQELDEAVTFLRQQKKSLKEIDINENEPVSNPTNSPTDSTFDLSQKIALKLTPPLPYRIAKALDPSLYRNVARDIVEEEKREAKLRYRNCGFFPGDKCQVVLSSQPSKAYNAFIQELTDNQGPVVVFVEDLGEKRTVPYSSLRHFPASRNGCRYSLSESGYVPYIDKKNKRKKANIGAGMPVPSDLNSYQANRRQHTRNWVQCSGKGMQLPPQPVEYANSIDVTSPYCSVAVGNQAIMSNPTNIPIPNSTTYFMPVINVPYPPNIGHVNFNCVPSQDPYGKDLPQDVNTLRYFYNFGVEHASSSSVNRTLNSGSCRMMSSVMQPQPMPYTPTVLQAESTGHVIMPTPLEHGQSRKSDKIDECCMQKPNSETDNNAMKLSVNDKDELSEKDAQSESDNINDSIATSESSGKLESPGSDSGLDSTTSGAEETTTGDKIDCDLDKSDTIKPVKGKRKYYMYGNLKLIKPIKEIPPRFQMLLAETMAAKARCEGQPIYIQAHQEHLSEHETELNANARCFVPMQNCMPQSIPCTNTNLPNNTGVGMHNPQLNACLPPPPGQMIGGAHCPSNKMTNVNLPPQTLAQPPNLSDPSSSFVNTSSSSGGGGTCYYVYSSTSSGYGTVPPTPVTPPNSHGQVIYVMNSPYPAPMCQTYPAIQPMQGYGTCPAAAQ